MRRSSPRTCSLIEIARACRDDFADAAPSEPPTCCGGAKVPLGYRDRRSDAREPNSVTTIPGPREQASPEGIALAIEVLCRTLQRTDELIANR